MATASVQVVQMPPPHIVVPLPQQPLQHVKTIKGLAITQLVIGILSALLGIVAIASLHFEDFASTIGTGIWAGVWVAVTGLLGVCLARNKRTNKLNGVYMAFSIISSVASSMAVRFFSISIVIYSQMDCRIDNGWNNGYNRYNDYNGSRCRLKSLGLGLDVLSLILMIVEFFVSIVAAVYCCKSNGCSCCCQQQGVVIHQQPYMSLVEECGSTTTTGVATPAGPTVMTSTGGYPTNVQYVAQMTPQYVEQAAPQYSIQMQNPAGYGEQASGATEPPPMYSEKRLVDI